MVLNPVEQTDLIITQWHMAYKKLTLAQREQKNQIGRVKACRTEFAETRKVAEELPIWASFH
jgi:hypothetical protein